MDFRSRKKLFLITAVLIIVILGGSFGIRYLYISMRQKIELANYNAPSFGPFSNYIISNRQGKVKPGEEIVYNFYLKNTGKTDINNLKILIDFSEIIKIEYISFKDGKSLDKDYEILKEGTGYSVIRGNIVGINIGFLGIDDGGVYNIKTKVKNQPGDVMVIDSPEVIYVFEKESHYIDIDEKFTEKLDSAPALIVDSSPEYIPIIAIHGVTPEPVGRWEISTESFEHILSLLKSNGYTTVTFMDVLDYLDNDVPLPEKPVIISSDDGYKSLYTYAFPLLKKYEYNMSVFLSTGYIGENEADRREDEFNRANKTLAVREMLIWPEIKEMAGYGIEFQSHGVTHKNFINMGDEESFSELVESKEVIEKNIGKPVLFISWPFSGYTENDLKLALEAGYRGAAIYGGGIEDIRSMDLLKIKRIPIESNIKKESFKDLIMLE